MTSKTEWQPAEWPGTLNESRRAERTRMLDEILAIQPGETRSRAISDKDEARKLQIRLANALRDRGHGGEFQTAYRDGYFYVRRKGGADGPGN